MSRMDAKDSYLRWLADRTPTSWWDDTADPEELQRGFAQGAMGVTTNPVLAAAALKADPGKWSSLLRDFDPGWPADRKAEFLLHGVVTRAAALFLPRHESSGGKQGYACAQVAPLKAGDRGTMLGAARRIAAWSPNIAVKLPATAAGLDVLEDCIAEGITVTSTVSFTVPQVVAAAERHRRGAARARAAGREPGRCFAVIMIGRLDDYLRDVALDRGAAVGESDIRTAGIAVTRRAYAIFRERRYEAVLMVAAMRGTHHIQAFTGAELILSIHPTYQAMIREPSVPRDPHGIEAAVDPAAVDRLMGLREFVRAYEPDGMAPEEFLSCGITQRTLSEFQHNGFGLLEKWR
jgi:transaldolase